MAAMAFRALWRPGIGKVSFVERRARLAVPVAEQHREARPPWAMITSRQPHVGLRVLAVGDEAAVLDAADQRLHGRMVDAHNGEAVEGHVLDEGAEASSTVN